MSEITFFYNEVLNNNRKIVEQYTNNPSDVIRLSENIDIDTLRDLVIEFNNALLNEELTPIKRIQIKKVLIATILAIKKAENSSNLTKKVR